MTEAGPQGSKVNMAPRTDNLPTRESVTAFIKGNIVPASYKRIVCGDGRYTPDQSKGGLHMFGGDMGAIAAIWKAGKDLDPEHFTATDENIRTVVDAYQKAKERILGTPEFGNVPADDARKLYIHTDQHVHGDKISGCGHINNMGTNGALAEQYGVPNDDVKKIYQFIKDHKQGEYEETMLEGDHAEQTVMYVHGSRPKQGEQPGRAAYTLNSSSADGSEMHFVVDQDRVMEYFNRLSTALPLFVQGLTAEALQQAYAKQELTTAKKLAAGYQIVDVYINDDKTFEIDIQEDNKVPAL